MKFSSFVAISVSAAALALSGAAFAQTTAADHTVNHPADATVVAMADAMAAAMAAAAATPIADGEVRKIDKEQGKVTLKHGPIANLDMPGMTMVFKVSDLKMLDALKQGDKVRFAASNLNGTFTVTAIETVK